MAAMAEATGPRALFLGGLAAVYIAAFGSLYVQIPGLYGRQGLLPARRLLRLSLGQGLWEQLSRFPTLLWFCPDLGLDTEQGMELLCVLGVLGSLGALLCPSLRHCLIFALLRMFYLSLYQVGQVFLYFQWDSLLLEAGFLAVLVAPLKLWPGGTPRWQPHDGVPLWGVRWLLFRLLFQSGAVKLSSRCPTWWGLTALTHHFETQCLPSPGSWWAHQLPLWLLKLGVVATLAIEVAVPPLFFAPLRRLRLVAFYCQVLLQTLIILTGNYNFFNVLTIVLCFSLLDQQHLQLWLGRPRRAHGPAETPAETPGWPPRLGWLLARLLEVATLGALLLGTARCFGLTVHGGVLESNVAFTHHEFSSWLGAVTLPLVGVAFLSLSWEILVAFYRCARTRGIFWKLWAILQWALMATATLGLFTISLVPFTSLDAQSQARLWPGVRGAAAALERFQLVNSYGLFRRITGTNGRPEVILQGSHDGHSWTEMEFMYKPGNVSVAPALVAPHQPRLDWQLWFAALGPHHSSPWFSALVLRLLQGQPDVIRLLQSDESRYRFHSRPPTFVRAQLYRYRFTRPGQGPAWWRRQLVGEFFPPVSLGHPTLEGLLSQHGLKDTPPVSARSVSPLSRFLSWLRRLSRPLSGPVLLWSLYLGVATVGLLRALGQRARGAATPARHRGSRERGERDGPRGTEGTARGTEGTARGTEGTARGTEGTARGTEGTARGTEGTRPEARHGSRKKK